MKSNDTSTTILSGAITFMLIGLITSIFSKGGAILFYVVGVVTFVVGIAHKVDKSKKDNGKTIDGKKTKVNVIPELIGAVLAVVFIVNAAKGMVKSKTPIPDVYDPVLIAATADGPESPEEQDLSSTSEPEEKPEAESRAESKVESVQEVSSFTFVLNTNTKKYHRTFCDSVSQIKPENYEEIVVEAESISEAEIEIQRLGYSACKQCN